MYEGSWNLFHINILLEQIVEKYEFSLVIDPTINLQFTYLELY